MVIGLIVIPAPVSAVPLTTPPSPGPRMTPTPPPDPGGPDDPRAAIAAVLGSLLARRWARLRGSAPRGPTDPDAGVGEGAAAAGLGRPARGRHNDGFAYDLPAR